MLMRWGGEGGGGIDWMLYHQGLVRIISNQNAISRSYCKSPSLHESDLSKFHELRVLNFEENTSMALHRIETQPRYDVRFAGSLECLKEDDRDVPIIPLEGGVLTESLAGPAGVRGT